MSWRPSPDSIVFHCYQCGWLWYLDYAPGCNCEGDEAGVDYDVVDAEDTRMRFLDESHGVYVQFDAFGKPYQQLELPWA